MPLSAGQTLTFYEILGPLGAGGMGEVYRARDTRLDREVAIKVLPEELASDEDRLRRFEREAKTLAALNHTNIGGIHGVDRAGNVSFLALELVPGEDLADRLAHGPLRVAEAIDITRQIAEGLEAAHEAGIVHRDLKPANVRITPEGVVKILDFGLAKPMVSRSSKEGARTAQSDSFLITEDGLVLGTPTYMSPEQARGKPTNRCTDIWAFGCVLYECLTGKRTFDGDSVSDVIAAVLDREPDLSRLPAATPASVRRLVRLCLVKDARRRLRDAGDARIILEEPAGEDVEPATTRSAIHPLALGLCGVAVLALGWSLGSRGAGEDGSRADVLPAFFRQVSDLPGAERQPSLSPDGKSVLYVHSSPVENADIFLQRVEGRTPINLTPNSTVDDSAPAFSPDGEWIAFRSERGGGGIFVMGATGESVRRVTDFGYDPTWSPDGTELAVSTEPVLDPLSRDYLSELWVVSVDGSRKRQLITGGDAVGPCWSPDGKRIACWGWRDPDWQRDIFTIAADGSESQGKPVTDDAPVDWSPAWAADGSLYFSSNRGGTMNLWRVELDASGTPISALMALTAPASWSGGYSLSADGQRLAYATRGLQTDVLTVGFDPQAGTLLDEPRTIFGGRGIIHLAWSPAGDRLVLSQLGYPWESLVIIRADGSGYTRITDASVQHRAPTWRPMDGSELILFYSNTSLMTIHSDGSNARMVEPGVRSFGGSWSIDGKQVMSNDVNESWEVQDFVKFDVSSDGTFRRADWDATPVMLTGLNGLDAWTSIGGLSLAAGTSQQPGLFEVDMASGEFRKLVEIDGPGPNGSCFLPDGRRFLYKLGNRLYCFDTRSLEQELVLDFERGLIGGYSRGMSLSRDGSKLAFLSQRDEGDIWVIELDAVGTTDPRGLAQE